MEIRYELLEPGERKKLPAGVSNLPFGTLRTDHMFLVDYSDGEWHDARIVPYAPLQLMPGAVALHYGQTLFEGAKAFRHPDNEIYLWRFDKNAERLNHSARNICMAEIPEELQKEGVERLIDVERAWCPEEPDSSLYIRPFMYGTQDILGVRPSNTYTYCIMLSPCGPYYKGGPTKTHRLLISSKYHRAVSGGTGTSKVGGNYAASLLPAEYAFSQKADQVLYLDSTNTYIEEAGSMNHYHVLRDGTFIIPEFTDSILKSITSSTVLELAQAGKVAARQERIRFREFLDAIRSGDIIEAGGFGTAAVVSPVGEYLLEDGSRIRVADGEVGRHSRAMYELYNGMQTGRIPAPEGWTKKVDHF